MKYSCFQAVCAYEIGDYVNLKGDSVKHKIIDILAIHSVLDNKVWFILKLDNGLNVAVNPKNGGEPHNEYE